MLYRQAGDEPARHPHRCNTSLDIHVQCDEHDGSLWELGGLVSSGSATLVAHIGRNHAGTDFTPTNRTGSLKGTGIRASRPNRQPERDRCQGNQAEQAA